MAANPFDQFDAPAANPFDQFDAAPPVTTVTASRDAVPAPRSLAKRFGASVVGLADTVTGIVPQAIAETGYAGVRALESAGLAKPGQAQRGKEAFLRKFGTPFGSAFDVTQTPEYQGEASQQLMQFIGENIGKGADWISTNTGIPKADVENFIFTGMFTLPAGYRNAKAGVQKAAPYVQKATTAIAESAPAQTVLKPLQERAAKKQEARVASSFQNAAKIDASNLAVKHGIILDPSESNPTAVNRITAGAAKSVTNFSKKASQLNDARFTQMAIEDMGLPANTVLDADAIKTALAQHDAAYDAVGKISVITPDLPALRQIESLRITRPPIGGEKNAATVNSLIDETLAKVREGRSGSEINVDIRNLRREAKQIYDAQQKSGVPDSTLIAKAETNISIANALEDLIDANAPNAEVLANLRKARTAKAKIFDYERALNNQTNRIDPQVLAKMAKDGKPLTGIAADIAKIASVFPDIAQTGVSGTSPLVQGLARSGAAGTAAAGTAALIGAPIAPFAAGGALAGYLGGGLAANRMLKPGYQARYAVPQDFRPPVAVNNLRPAPPSTTPNLPVPFDYRNALLTQNEIPNWVFGQSIPEGDVRVGTPRGPALEAPSAASTMRTVEQQRRFDYERQRAEAEAAAAQQAARESTSRAPTSGEVILELDPVTGKLRSVEPKTTPSSVMPSALESAVEKLSGQVIEDTTSKSFRVRTGKVDEQNAPTYRVVNKKTGSTFRYGENKAFDLTAEERIAWNKTKVDLAAVDAGFAKLSDKALAEKAMDRAWIAETVDKARQKAKAFEEIERRSKDAQQIARAKAEREKLMDVLEMLEPKLGRTRAVSEGGQGPKTREAIRNRLAGKNQNNLRND